MKNTRSSANNLQICHPVSANVQCFKQQVTLFDNKKPQSAFPAINLIESHQSHRYKCKVIKTLFEINKYKQALKILAEILIRPNQSCSICFHNFLKILDICKNIKIGQYRKVIYAAISWFDLRQPLKIKYYGLMKSLADKEKSVLLEQYKIRGCTASKISFIEVDEQHRISIANQKINEKQTIVFVPENEIITIKQLSSYEQIISLRVIKQKLYQFEFSQFALFLLIEKELGQKSKYYRYLRILPKELNNFPLFYDQSTLKELEGTNFLQYFFKMKQQITNDFEEIKKLLSTNMPYLNKTNFLWARMMVGSRIFNVFVGGQSTNMIVPVGDMFNHQENPKAKWYYCPIRKGFFLEALQSIEGGQQIVYSYGNKPNSKFLYLYGFTLENNFRNQVTFPVINYGTQDKFMYKMTVTKKIISIDLLEGLEFCRRQIIHKEKQLSRKQYEEINYCEFISIDNQLKTWKQMLYSLNYKYEDYLTSIDDDKILLKKLQPGKLRDCVVIRYEQKQILKIYIEMATKMIRYFEDPYKHKANKQMKQYLEFFNVIGFTPPN